MERWGVISNLEHGNHEVQYIIKNIHTQNKKKKIEQKNQKQNTK